MSDIFVYSKDPLSKVAVIPVTFQRLLNGDEDLTEHVPYVMHVVYIMPNWNVNVLLLKPRLRLKNKQILGPPHTLCNPFLRPLAPIQRQHKMIVS